MKLQGTSTAEADKSNQPKMGKCLANKAQKRYIYEPLKQIIQVKSTSLK